MDTPWSRARKTASERQERRIAQLPGGSRQVNSGRTLWQSKRDNKLMEFLVEARTTTHGSYSLSRDEFMQVKKEAHASPPGFMPAFQIDIQDLSVICIELPVFTEMQRLLVTMEAQIAELREQLAGEQE